MQTTPQATQFNTRKSASQTQGGVNWRHRFGSEQGLVETSVTGYLGTREVTQFLAIPAATQAPPSHGGGVIDFDRDYNGVDARALLHFGDTDLVIGVSQETQVDDRLGNENFIGTPPNQTLGVAGRCAATRPIVRPRVMPMRRSRRRCPASGNWWPACARAR